MNPRGSQKKVSWARESAVYEMSLKVIQYQRQNYFTAVEECPLLVEMNPSHNSFFSDGERNRVSACLWDSWSRLPALACRGILFQEMNGGNAMTCLRKENQVSILSLSFKRVASEIPTADLKVPNETGHSHISSAYTHPHRLASSCHKPKASSGFSG